MANLVGSTVDKYEMLEEVGHGGMAVVYRGLDNVLEREVAVKVLHAHLADREESRLRLRREALAVAKLRHENILEIFDYSGADTEESYIVTEFIHGPTLREWMDGGHEVRPAIAALVVHRLCMALMHAHKAGIIHRDIKPENVMIRSQDGCVKLMDFGIAQILDNQKLTMTGQLLGSPAYMAPELISGKPLDARTDLFSMGILLYQLSTGELPFQGRNPHEVLNRIADGEFTPASRVNPLVDPDLEAIIARALSVNPADRYQTAEALARELETYLEEMGIEPGNDEIVRYFQDTSAYVAELDRRVCTTLLERAAAAAADGYQSRAIRLLSRILELQPEHPEARALLDRLRKRERRTRQLLMAGGVVAVVGLLGAGAMLMESSRERSLEPVATVDMDEPRRPMPTQPAEEGAPPPPTEVDPGLPAAAGGTGEDGGDGKPVIRPPPRKPAKKAIAARVTTCNLAIEGPSFAQANYLHITVDGGKRQALEGFEHKITMTGETATVRISGDWTAKEVIDRAACEAGAVTLPLLPKPCELRVENAPDDGALRCIKDCPPGAPEGVTPVNRFHVTPWPRSQTSVTVTMEFKSKTRGNRTKTVMLKPGPTNIEWPN